MSDNVVNLNKQPSSQQSNDVYGYDKLNAAELRKVISDLVIELEHQTTEKKETNRTFNESIKALKQRLSAALQWLGIAERR